ncbi:MAG: alpha/beta hydrolase [Bacteroidota bacterium]
MELQPAFDQFLAHYAQRLDSTSPSLIEKEQEHHFQFQVQSERLKVDNYPTIFHHRRKTDEVIILTHGLSDSPFYMKAVGERFYRAGFNVVFPLLPAHGLKQPDQAFEDRSLDQKWRKEIDHSVNIAQQLGKRVSIGGFSTGGALSYNFLLRRPGTIHGALFLFSAALAIPVAMSDTLSQSKLVQLITKMRDGEVNGIGKDPYKYPDFPEFGVVELGQIIAENNDIVAKQQKIENPVFAAHSVHDTSAKLEGITQMLTANCKVGTAFIISEEVAHAELPLAEDIQLDHSREHGPEKAPKANPQFEQMMSQALQFVEKVLA